MHKIQVLGCGPGHPDFVTPFVGKILDSCNWIMGCTRTAALYPQHQIFINDGRIIESINLLHQKHLNGLKCAVLVTGDVGLFSLTETLRKHLGSELLECHPGISSVQYACAKLNIPWQHICIISAHGRSLESNLNPQQNFALLAGGLPSLGEIQLFLNSLESTYTFWACQQLSLDDESILSFKPHELAHILSQKLLLIIGIHHKENK